MSDDVHVTMHEYVENPKRAKVYDKEDIIADVGYCLAVIKNLHAQRDSLKARGAVLEEVRAMYADMVVKYQRALEEINKQKCNRYVAGNGYTCLEVNATKLCCVCIATKALQEDSHE